jgi:hypothetical protein
MSERNDIDPMRVMEEAVSNGDDQTMARLARQFREDPFGEFPNGVSRTRQIDTPDAEAAERWVDEGNPNS